MNYWTPVLLLIASNVIYNICSKSTPSGINPLAMLTIVYLIGAILAGILYYVVGDSSESLLEQYKHLNWAGILMGFSIVGLEAGSIYMYKAGWDISVGFMFSSTIVALSLAIIGALIYKEQVTLTKLSGMVVCLIGLFLINK